MKNGWQYLFSNDNIQRIFREQSRASLIIIFAVFWFYSMLCLRSHLGAFCGKAQSENTAGEANKAVKERLLTLKSKADAFERRMGAASLCLRDSAAVPFDTAPEKYHLSFALEKSPPVVKVRALGLRGKAKVALIDIDGEECRLMYEQDTFGMLGRVLMIDDEGVVWIWGTKEFRSLIWE